MLKNNLVISVIIPCYNSQNTIIECFDSAWSQTYKNLEIIIIDDGSSDHSTEIIKSRISTLGFPENVHLLMQENKGPSAARNHGVRASSGDWVAFLDSDDYWHPDKLSIQIEYIVKDPELTMLSVQAGDGDKDINSLSLVTFRQLLFKNVFKTSGVLLKRQVALEIPFDERMRYSEDYKVWLMVAAKYKAGYVSRILCGTIADKRAFGDSGLSGNLSAMQQGEISNYRFLLKNGYISQLSFLQCLTYSYLKYLRRMLISSAQGFKQVNK